MVMQIIHDSLELVNNQYGNYLLQHLVEQRNEECNRGLHQRLGGHYAVLSRQKFSSNVVEKCLKFGSASWREAIIHELMDLTALGSLLQDSYGNYVMQHALAVAEGEQRAVLVELIRPQLNTLRKNIRKKWERLLNLTSPHDLDSSSMASSSAASPANSFGGHSAFSDAHQHPLSHNGFNSPAHFQHRPVSLHSGLNDPSSSPVSGTGPMTGPVAYQGRSPAAAYSPKLRTGDSSLSSSPHQFQHAQQQQQQQQMAGYHHAANRVNRGGRRPREPTRPPLPMSGGGMPYRGDVGGFDFPNQTRK